MSEVPEDQSFVTGEASYYTALKNQYGENYETEVVCSSSPVAAAEVLESSYQANQQYDEAAQVTSTVALSLEEMLGNIEAQLTELDAEVNLSSSIEIGNGSMLPLGITVEHLMPGLSKRELTLAREDIKSKIVELIRRFIEMIMNALGSLARYFRNMFGEFARIKKIAEGLQVKLKKATRHSPINNKVKVGSDFGVLSTDIAATGDFKADKAANNHNTDYLWKLFKNYVFLSVTMIKELSAKTTTLIESMTTTVENADAQNLMQTLEVLNKTAFSMVSSKETEAFFTRIVQDGGTDRTPVLTFTAGKPIGNVAIKNSEIVAANRVIQLQNIMLESAVANDQLMVAAGIQESGIRIVESDQKYHDVTGSIEPISPTIVGNILTLIIDYCNSINSYNSNTYPKLEQGIQKYAKAVRALGTKVAETADSEDNQKTMMAMTRYIAALKQWSTRSQADLIRLSRVVLHSYLNVCDKSLAEYTE